MKRRKSLSRKSEKKQLTSTYEEVYLKSDNIYYRCAKGFLPMIINNFLRGKDFNIPLFQFKVPETGVIFELNNKTMKYKISEIIKTNKFGEKKFKEQVKTLISETDKVAIIVGKYIILGKKITCPKKGYQIIETDDSFTLVSLIGDERIIGSYDTEKDAKKRLMLEGL